MNAPFNLGSVGRPLPQLWPEESAAPQADPALLRALRIAAGLFGVILLLAALVPIGGAVIGNGQVDAESYVKRIAHPSGGVITQILVANGDHVEKGALLLRLDDTVTGADATYSGRTVDQLLAQRARLEAERLGARTIAFPAELTSAGSDSANKAMGDERRLFASRQAEEHQMRAQLAARTDQYREQIRGFEAQIDALDHQRVLIQPEREGIRELWERKLVTISRLNQVERTAADIDGSIGALRAQVAQTRARMTEISEQSIQLGETRRLQAASDLAQVNTALNEQRLRSVAARDQRDRSEIRAPYSGTIEKLVYTAVGEVVRPAEPIMEIVPDSDAMVIEAAISPADIDQVRSGQEAQVRFTSFNRATTPEIAGKVAYVATDRSQTADGKSAFFMVRITVNQADLKRLGLALRAGMPAEVHIGTGSRSFLSFASKPLRDQFARAFRSD